MYRLAKSYQNEKYPFTQFFSNESRRQLSPSFIKAYRQTKTQLGKCSLKYTIETLAFLDHSNPYCAGFYQSPLPHKRRIGIKRILTHR